MFTEPKDDRAKLKVKIKSLAEEARIIRREERRYKGTQLRHELTIHRRTVVRVAAREAQLAYAFIRGRRLEQVERNPKTQPRWSRVQKMVEQYGARSYWSCGESYEENQCRRRDLLARFEEWKSGVRVAA